MNSDDVLPAEQSDASSDQESLMINDISNTENSKLEDAEGSQLLAKPINETKINSISEASSRINKDSRVNSPQCIAS